MKRILILALTILFVLSVGSFAFANTEEPTTPEPVIFTQAAKNFMLTMSADAGPLPILQGVVVKNMLKIDWSALMEEAGK